MLRTMLDRLDTLTETVARNVAACVRALNVLEKKKSYDLNNSFYDIQIELNAWMNGQYFTRAEDC